MSILLYKGSERYLNININSGSSNDPIDLTNANSISCCIQTLELTYLKKTGSVTSGSNVVTAIDVTGVVLGDDVKGTGIPDGAYVTAIGANTLTLNMLNSSGVEVVANATATVVAGTIGVGQVQIVDPIIGKIKIHVKPAASATLVKNPKTDIGYTFQIGGFISKAKSAAILNVQDDPC
jgi:hypothetical protein